MFWSASTAIAEAIARAGRCLLRTIVASEHGLMIANDIRQVIRNKFGFLLFRPIRPDFAGLLFQRLVRSAQLRVVGSVIGGLLPLSLVTVILAVLDLQHVTFDIMSGVKTEGTTGTEATYSIILALTVLSFAILPLSLLGCINLI